MSSPLITRGSWKRPNAPCGELTKLTQRNAAITAHLQQIQKQAQIPVDELKMAYDSALDALQRLFVMRGQLEKLQNDKVHFEKYRAVLEREVSGGSEASTSTPASGGKGQLSAIEMVVNA
jgi:hypothetical protein